MTKYLCIGRLFQYSFTFLWICCTAIFLSSCATKVNFATSTVVPSAEGQVKVKKDNNNNYSVKIEVNHLADPSRLPQPQNVYVVWAETVNGPQNLGQLKTETGFIMGKLKANLETVTPHKPSRIFVTAENSATIQSPGNYVVLNTSSF